MPFDPIARVRRFNRAVTAEVGALDTSFLGLGRPLGAARVLNAIGRGRGDVSEVRAYLDLDSGLMSRLLRSLEEEGVIETSPHPDDARRRVATLTEAGRREYEAYERLSDARAEATLARHAHPDALLRAMDLVATALAVERIEIVETDPREDHARSCLESYYAELGRRFSQGYDAALACSPDARDMIRPRGVFLVAMSDGMPVGCVGLKGRDDGFAEVKRLWVAPAARGLGLAKRLMAATETAARDLGIGLLRLDTNSALNEAVAFYRKDGWREIPRFNDDPYPDAFYEKAL